MQQEHHQGRVWRDISEFSTMGILSWILLCHRDLSCASRKLSSIFGLRSLDASSSSPVVKNKNVSYCMHVNSSPTLCDPMDCSPSGSSVHGILQTRILEWVAISYPRGSSWPRDWTHVSMGDSSPRCHLGSPRQMSPGEGRSQTSEGNNPGPALACAPSISVSSGEPLFPSGPYPLSGWHCLLIQDDWATSVLHLWPPPTCAVGEVTISGENLMLSSLGQVCDCQNPLRRESSVLDVFIKPQNHVCDSRKIMSSPFHSFHQPLLPTIQDPIIFRRFMTWPQAPQFSPYSHAIYFFFFYFAKLLPLTEFPSLYHEWQTLDSSIQIWA